MVAPEHAVELHLDTARIAIGGLSAGGGLAAITGLKIASSDDKTLTHPIIQLLICPVIDNTVNVDTDPAERTGWQASQYSPWLTPTRMQWYRGQYFQGAPPTTTAEWTASPCYAPAALLAASPPTFLGIAGCDLLAPEAKAYGAQLTAAGVSIDVKTYAGGTHSVLVLAGRVYGYPNIYRKYMYMLTSFTESTNSARSWCTMRVQRSRPPWAQATTRRRRRCCHRRSSDVGASRKSIKIHR